MVIVEQLNDTSVGAMRTMTDVCTDPLRSLGRKNPMCSNASEVSFGSDMRKRPGTMQLLQKLRKGIGHLHGVVGIALTVLFGLVAGFSRGHWSCSSSSLLRSRQAAAPGSYRYS